MSMVSALSAVGSLAQVPVVEVLAQLSGWDFATFAANLKFLCSRDTVLLH
jgi:hypothetical protein